MSSIITLQYIIGVGYDSHQIYLVGGIGLFQSNNALVFLGYEVKSGVSKGTQKPYSFQQVRLADPVTFRNFDVICTGDFSKIPVGSSVQVSLQVETRGFKTSFQVSAIEVL